MSHRYRTPSGFKRPSPEPSYRFYKRVEIFCPLCDLVLDPIPRADNDSMVLRHGGRKQQCERVGMYFYHPGYVDLERIEGKEKQGKHLDDDVKFHPKF